MVKVHLSLFGVKGRDWYEMEDLFPDLELEKALLDVLENEEESQRDDFRQLKERVAQKNNCKNVKVVSSNTAIALLAENPVKVNDFIYKKSQSDLINAEWFVVLAY